MAMPFGMGPAGWFMVPYFYPYWPASYGYGLPYLGRFSPFFFGQDELSYLRQLRQNLEAQLKDIDARIQELEGANN